MTYKTSKEIAQPTPREDGDRPIVNKAFPVAALIFSVLSLIGTGVMLAQLTTLRQDLNGLEESVSQLSATANQSAPVPSPDAVVPDVAPPPADTTTELPETTAPSTELSSDATPIAPGQFVQPSFGTKGEVELLKVNRIPNQPNVVNVQFRVRLLQPEGITGSDVLTPTAMSARNPMAGETYGVYQNKGTSSFSLATMRLNNQPSADAYAWLQVPKGVEKIDIYIPNTQTFESVPISPN